MNQLPFMSQMGGFSIPAPQGASAMTMLGSKQNALAEKQLEEQKKRANQSMYFDLANTLFKGLSSIGGLLG